MAPAALLFALAVPAQTVTTASTATTSVRRPTHHGPAIAIFETYSPRIVRGLLPLSDQRRRAFGGELSDAAAEVFSWRRWRIIPEKALAVAIEELTEAGECQDDLCFARIGVEIGATHALISSIVSPRNLGCRATVALYDLRKAELITELDRSISPCTDDNLLSVAAEIGREIAEGPRAPVQVTLNLTPRIIPNLDIPDVPNVSRYLTDTATRAGRVFELERALEIYEEKHMYVFDSDDGETYYIARDGRILSECDVRKVASVARPKEIEEFCYGNNYEFWWIGAVIGGLGVFVSYSDFLDGGFLGTIGMGISGAGAIASATMALVLNVDKSDPRDGRYYSSRAEIEAIVQNANRQLREELDLREAEVVVAGMRL
jgi:hypothetical protein